MTDHHRPWRSALPDWRWGVMLMLMLAACASTRPQPAERQAVDPDFRYAVPAADRDGWPTQSLSAAGIRPEPLAALVDRIRDRTFPRVYSVVLVKDGTLAFEAYFEGRHRFHAHAMHSVSKSVTAILVGIAVDRGLFSVDDPVVAYFDDFHGLEWIDRPYPITVEHLLTMAHGTDWDERSRPLSDPRNSIRAMTAGDDWLGFVLGHRLIEPPGVRFNYAGGMTVLLGEIVARTSGMDLGAFAERYLFQPMGIHIEGWHRSRRGVVNCQGGLYLRPRDMAKIGQLMLDKGVWQGHRIVSEQWVEACLTRRVTAEIGRGYGYQWRLGQAVVGGRLVDLFFAAGRGGQHIIVVPERRLVAVFTTEPIGNPGGPNRNLIMMTDYVLPAVMGPAATAPATVVHQDRSRYVGRYRHGPSGETADVSLGLSGLLIWPSFYWCIPVAAAGPETFTGYSHRIGRLQVRFSPGDDQPADRLEARFLFGRRVYERVGSP